jgi:hypothetical protein
MSALITPGSDGLPSIDLPAEYRLLQDWSSALDARLASLKGISAQLHIWEAETPDDDLLMIQLNRIMACAAAAEADALGDAFAVVDVGFDVLYALADANGIDPYDLDDDLG